MQISETRSALTRSRIWAAPPVLWETARLLELRALIQKPPERGVTTESSGSSNSPTTQTSNTVFPQILSFPTEIVKQDGFQLVLGCKV
jgi:hypothetical protein